MRPIVVVHSSNEMYGSDRMVLEVLSALPAVWIELVEVWLPGDTPESQNPLEPQLREAGFKVKILPLPIARRSRLRPRGILGLARDSFRTLVRLAHTRPHTVYCATSATLIIAFLSKLVGTKKIILHNQEIWGSGLETKLLRMMARFATDIVAISEASRHSLGLHLSVRAETIPNGVPDPVRRWWTTSHC